VGVAVSMARRMAVGVPHPGGEWIVPVPSRKGEGRNSALFTLLVLPFLANFLDFLVRKLHPRQLAEQVQEVRESYDENGRIAMPLRIVSSRTPCPFLVECCY
jgi:hypothetical protein